MSNSAANPILVAANPASIQADGRSTLLRSLLRPIMARCVGPVQTVRPSQ